MARDPEQALRGAISAARLMAHTRAISRWVRLSGGDGEARAFDYLESALREYGLDVRRYTHDALISWPGPAVLEVAGAQPQRIECITHAFAASTPPAGVDADVADVGGGPCRPADVRGKIALIDGLATPVMARAAEDAGAAGAIFIGPPHLHEMIISTVWGAPTPETAGALPKLVAVSIREPDGAILRTRAWEGRLRVRIAADVETRWRATPLLTADLPGRTDPDRFVLFSGHVDSWHYGAMDNGSADAVMLEMARVLSRRRRRLRRGIRFAFWSGHSHGRYSGSTWYADTHWDDLYRHAVLHLNVDSSGGIGATVLSEAETMAETWAAAAQCVRDVCGQELGRHRVSRMGDQSFWGIGVPSMFVDLSTQPAHGRDGAPPEGASRGGDSGGGMPPAGALGWWWHTPEDTVDKIDRANLRRDAEVYALMLWRWCTAAVLPLDYAAAAEELQEVLAGITHAAGEALDLRPAIDAARGLAEAAARMNVEAGRLIAAIAGGTGTRKQRAAAAVLNEALMRAGRALIPATYTASGPFDHDRAVPVPPVPVLQPASGLRSMPPDSMEFRTLYTRLVRERNKVTHAIHLAAEALEEGLRRAGRPAATRASLRRAASPRASRHP